MINGFKKKLLSIITVVFIASMVSMSVCAASYTSGSIGGYTVSGSISMGSTSASATTSIAGTTATVVVDLDYKYGFGTDTYIVGAANGTGASYITVSASSAHYGSVSIGAKATHNVYYGAYTWYGNTSTGQSF